MHLITQRQLIQNVAKKWRENYEPFANDAPFGNGNKTKKQVAEELDALDKNKATAKDVARVIGNDSWAKMICNECGKSVDAVLQVGQELDYESHTANLCMECVRKASELAAKEQSA